MYHSESLYVYENLMRSFWNVMCIVEVSVEKFVDNDKA